MTSNSYQMRIHNHTETALAGHLLPSERIEAVVVQGGPAIAFGIWARLLPFASLVGGAMPHLVVTNERLLVCEFGRGFPAKGDAAVAPATVTAERVRHPGEMVDFARSARELDEPGRMLKPKVVRIDESTTFWPAKGWSFEPAAA